MGDILKVRLPVNPLTTMAFSDMHMVHLRLHNLTMASKVREAAAHLHKVFTEQLQGHQFETLGSMDLLPEPELLPDIFLEMFTYKEI